MTTSPGRWATAERLYHGALARPTDERAAFPAEACAGDEELRREVESLVAQRHGIDARSTFRAGSRSRTSGRWRWT